MQLNLMEDVATGADRFELDAEQLEWVVGEVVRRLLAGAGGEHQAAGGAQRGAADLTLTERVVTAIALEGKLHGVARVLVPSGAVVTPAARDLLRDRQVELVRG